MIESEQDFISFLSRHMCQRHSCVSAGEVIFDRNHPALPPDIIFSSEDDFMEFDPDIEQLKVDRHLVLHVWCL